MLEIGPWQRVAGLEARADDWQYRCWLQGYGLPDTGRRLGLMGPGLEVCSILG